MPDELMIEVEIKSWWLGFGALCRIRAGTGRSTWLLATPWWQRQW